MADELDLILATHPLTKDWLGDIVRVLGQRTSRTAHVQEIVRELGRIPERDKDTIEQIITRRINDHCSDAHDFDHKRAELFEKVKPATFRLKDDIDDSALIEMRRIKFDEPAIDETWKWFSQIAKERAGDRWAILSNKDRLLAFWRNLQTNNAVKEEMERRRELFSSLPELDLDSFLPTRS